MRARTRRTAAGVVAAALAVLHAPLVPGAQAAETSLVTTSSTRTVDWAPRHPDDQRPEVREALEGFRLRVSQTADLLNQTVQVTWEGGATSGNATFLQLMQCWSDAPTASPRREQCAFGGLDAEGAEGTGSARTRQLSTDPRERTYRNDGDLLPVTVAGGNPTPTWSGDAEVVFGTTAKRCAPAATGYDVRLVPGRQVDAEEALVEGPTSAPPASLTRTVNGFQRTYPVVTAPVRLGEHAQAPGVYRVQLRCLGAAGATTLSLFAGWVEKSASTGLWRVSPHEGGVFVPFDPLGEGAEDQATDPFERNEVLEYVKPRSTNEVWYAGNNPSGGGEAFVEVLTDLEAQHLGCGRPRAVHGCWLVAVPRWAGEPDGSTPGLNALASPLSQTLWDRRVEVPLQFAPVDAGCRIGSGLKQLLTHDSAVTAVRSWQPTFCEDASTASSVLGPLQDFSVRLGVSQPNRMGFVGLPEEGRPTNVVAPVATSGVVIGFSIDRQIPYGGKDYALNGTRETELNLTPRLVAKLLSQSYDSGAAPNGGKESGYNGSVYSGGFRPTFTPARQFPSANPRTLYEDKEFLALNPEIAGWLAQGASLPPQDMADVLVAAGDTDAYQVLWRWVLSDPEARAFLGGEPDPEGMRVNPYYRGQLTAQTSSFPLLDPTCVDDIETPEADGFPLKCQVNVHPRVEDDGEAAQAAVRGDSKRVDVAPLVFDATSAYKAQPRQEIGRRALLVVTTSAVAARYGLPTARLRNASDAFVAATAESLAAARSAMTVRPDGVLVPAPEQVRGRGYPLTTMSYAVVDVAATTQSQNDAFARMLDYAVGPGQQPGSAIGQLPPGYAPLPPALVAQAKRAAATLRDPSALLPGSGGPADGGATQGPGRAPGGAVPPLGTAPLPTADPGTDPAPVVDPATAPPAHVALPAAATPGASAAARWLLPALLAAAVVSALSGRVLLTVGMRRPPNSGASGAGGSTPAPLPPES